MRARAAHSSWIIGALALLGSLLSAAPASAQPVAVDDAYATNEGTTLTVAQAIGVRANDNLDGLGNGADAIVLTGPGNGTLTLGQNGNFTYVPNANFNGTDTFTYRLRYLLVNFSNVATVTIVVNPVNDAPTGVVNRSYSTSEDTPLAVPAPGVLTGVTDVDGDSVSAQLVTAPSAASGALVLNPNGSFNFTPATGFVGNATFTYRAVDDQTPPGQSANATVTIAVRGVNDAPVANADTYVATEDTVRTVTAPGVLANDTDPDTGTTLSAVLVTAMPATEGTVTLNANGAFTFRPALNFSGVTSFTYNARDNATPPTVSATPATVTITVNAVNDAPSAVADLYQTNENTALTVAPATGVLSNDTDLDSTTLTAQLVTSIAPASGTLSLSPNGSFVYTPAAGYSGTATFSYRAVDNGTPPVQSATAATVTITILNANDPPVAVANTYTANEDTVLTVPAPGVLANDTDPDPGTVLNAILVTPPARGTVTLNLNGSFTYAPALDYQGPDSFTYRARDNGTPPLSSTPATVTLNVASVNDAPRLRPGLTALPSQTATEHVPFGPLALAQFFVDPENSPLTFTVSGLPAGLSATPDGIISGAPALNSPAGTISVNVVVSDGQRQFATTFPLIVLAAGRTDLALTAAAAPSPSLTGQEIVWTFVIENRSPIENVGNVALQVVFVAPAPFAVTPNAACTATPDSTGATVTCAAGPILAGGQATVSISAISAQPGDAVASATVTITDSVPLEAAPENDTATAAVSIAQTPAAGPAQTLSATGQRASAAADFDGDGFVDLAVADENGTVIYPNVPDSSTPGSIKRLLAAQPIRLPDTGPSTSVAAADFDGDGALDLVVAKATGPSVVLRNPNDRTFAFVAFAGALGTETGTSNTVAARDLDGDGRTDIVLGNSSPNPVFKNEGNGVFTQIAALGNEDSRDVVLADLVGDTAPELVFANADRSGGATVYRFDSATNRYVVTTLATGPATSVAAADFNGDGRVDLVFGRAQSKLVLFNATAAGGALQFSPPLDLGAAPTTDVLALDTDNDGDVDIVGINGAGGHQIYTNGGAGQFTLRAEQFTNIGARHATAAKLSSDDRIDVAVIGSSTLDVFYNDGAGNLGKGDTGAPVLQLRGQATVDLTVESPYTDAGATASDAVDGDLTAKVKVDNPVNSAVVGTYTVTYSVVDNSGNAATPVTRTVRVGVRSGTGGGGGGSIDLAALLALVTLAALGALQPLRTRRKSS